MWRLFLKRTKTTGNCKVVDFNHPTLVWRRFSQKSLPISINNLYIAGNLSHWPTFCRWYYGSIFIRVLWWAKTKRRIFAAIECISAVQGHSRSIIYESIENEYAYATSYYSIRVTLVLALPFLRYGDLTENCKIIITPLSFYPLQTLPLKVCGEVKHEKIESSGYPPVTTAWS